MKKLPGMQGRFKCLRGRFKCLQTELMAGRIVGCRGPHSSRPLMLELLVEAWAKKGKQISRYSVYLLE
jgi:hypothetical protein